MMMSLSLLSSFSRVAIKAFIFDQEALGSATLVDG